MANINLRNKYNRGDSVIVLPDKKIGIVCEPVNEKGVLRIQLPGKKSGLTIKGLNCMWQQQNFIQKIMIFQLYLIL